MWDVTPNLYVPERKIVFAVYLLYILAGGLIKISILLFYRRLDARCIPSTFRIATWLSIAIITIFITAFTINRVLHYVEQRVRLPGMLGGGK